MDIPVNMNNINKGGSGQRPRMLMCYLCGNEFGSKSLPIHLPQCQKKWEAREMAKHPKDRRPMPQPPAPETPIKVGLNNSGASNIQELNDAAYEQFKKTLTTCQNCQRKFRPEAFTHHEKSCLSSNPAKPAGTGLTPSSLSNNKRIKAYTFNSPSSKHSKSKNIAQEENTEKNINDNQSTQIKEDLIKTKASTSNNNNLLPNSNDFGQTSKGGRSFCEECGSMFGNPSAKFCGECGAKKT